MILHKPDNGKGNAWPQTSCGKTCSKGARPFGKNQHLAYHRAQQAKNMIYEGIKARGFNPAKVVFTDERFLEQGPPFSFRDDNTTDEKYMPFQYIKILPTENITEN